MILCEQMWRMAKRSRFGCHVSLPNLAARQIAEHELTGHGVYRSWCRFCSASIGSSARSRFSRGRRVCPKVASTGESFGCNRRDSLSILCVKWRNSSTRCLAATVVVRKSTSNCASSYLTAFIARLKFKRILSRSDTARSLLSLIERVSNNLLGVALVLVTSPESDHAADCLAKVSGRKNQSTHKNLEKSGGAATR